MVNQPRFCTEQVCVDRATLHPTGIVYCRWPCVGADCGGLYFNTRDSRDIFSDDNCIVSDFDFVITVIS